jgi:hypothetical protein
MIKKPETPTLADYVRGNKEIINRKIKAKKEYEEYILSYLLKEFGTASLGELLFCVVEKHHKTLKNKHQRGVRQQWSSLLGAMIKVEVDSRRARGATLKAVIHELGKEPLWNSFVLNSEEQFRKIYKQKHDAFAYKYVKNIRKSDDEWNELVKAEHRNFLQIQK